MDIGITELDTADVEIADSVHALVGFVDRRPSKPARSLRVTGFVFTSAEGKRVSVHMDVEEMRELRRLMDMAMEE